MKESVLRKNISRDREREREREKGEERDRDSECGTQKERESHHPFQQRKDPNNFKSVLYLADNSNDVIE